MSNTLPPLYYFQESLKSGLPDVPEGQELTANYSGSEIMYDENGDEYYVNFLRGLKNWGQKNPALTGGILGTVAGAGTTLLITDLVNKNKRRQDQNRFNAERQQLQSANAQASKQQQALSEEIATLQAQLAAQQTAPMPESGGGKNKTLLYVGIGVGALALIGIIAAASRR
jgi:hypothetical protein